MKNPAGVDKPMTADEMGRLSWEARSKDKSPDDISAMMSKVAQQRGKKKKKRKGGDKSDAH